MIRCGKLCSKCSAKTCKDLGTEAEPIEIECLECDGEGCEACDNTGMYRVDGCPQAYCRTVAPIVEMVDLFNKGLPPLAGGVLDQPAAFLSAAKFYNHEEAKANHAE